MLTPEQLEFYRKKYNVGPNATKTLPSAEERIAKLRTAAARKNEIDEYQAKMPEEKKKSLLRKVGDFFTSSEQAFGKTIGEATATLSKDYQAAQESQVRLDEMNKKLGEAIIEGKKQGKDTSRMERLYQDNTGRVFNIEEIIPSSQKSVKQIAGEALGTVADIAAFGKYGKALNVTKAKTAGQAFKMGAKKFGIEGSALGAGFGISGAMQEDESLKQITSAGVSGAITGGIIGAVLGGLSAKKQYQLPEKAAKMRQKAIDQYKRGLQATKEKYKEKSEKIIPELLEKKIWGTHKSLIKKAEAGIILSEKEYEQLGKLKGYAEIDGIVNMIDDEVGKYTLVSGRVSSVNTQRVNALNELKADILAVDAFDKIKDNKASQQALRELAQQYGAEVYETRKAQKTIMDNKTLSQVKKVDSAIRELLNKDPRNIKYAQINEAYHLNSELAEILSETAFKKEGHKFLNMIRSLSFGGGAVTGAVVGGAPGVVIGGFSLMALSEILNSTWWNTLRAVQKNQLAQKLEQKAGQELSQALILLSRQGIKAVNALLNTE